MIRIGIRRQIPICLLACLLVVVCCLLALRLPGEVAHFVKNGGYLPRVERASSDVRSRIGKLALLSRGRFFLRAEFQVWRGRIPEKSSKSGHFPLGVDCLYCRDRCSEILTTGPPITSSVLSQASHRIQ